MGSGAHAGFTWTDSASIRVQTGMGMAALDGSTLPLARGTRTMAVKLVIFAGALGSWTKCQIAPPVVPAGAGMAIGSPGPSLDV